jgi:CheY-like chemotaxis protein
VGPVLIVDDDADIRAGLAMLLATRGYHLAEAANGKQALDQLTGGLRPSLILLDLVMPVMNGWQFLTAVAKDEALARIPVVVLTGYRAMAERKLIPASVPLLEKPPDVQKLLSLVESYH